MTLEQYLLKARRALVSARLLLENGDIEGSCNRAYYAMFDAAHAALLRHQPGINPAETRTHNGLITAFGKHLIKTGLMTPELGRVLNQVEQIRLLADYTGEEIEPDKAAWVVEQASVFVETIQNSIRPKTLSD
ncbi:MAG TPA: HEPN domain-containing protein [Candidatus Competibacter sp.]|nr:HEPN domain-containing protein [Candidatus Competibacter sp.]